MAVHAPLQQVVYGVMLHAFLGEPQFFSSEDMSMQFPPMHVSPVPHAFPRNPQL